MMMMKVNKYFCCISFRVNRCEAAEPHHGETWCSTSKAAKNWRKKTKDILQIVARQLKPIDRE
jgi:hypothetical protein